jgi:hypothetical protein
MLKKGHRRKMLLDKRRPVFHLVRPLEVALIADSPPAGPFPAAIFRHFILPEDRACFRLIALCTKRKKYFIEIKNRILFTNWPLGEYNKSNKNSAKNMNEYFFSNVSWSGLRHK